MDELLTREEFKKQVFARTGGKCCVPGCDCDAVDAHHIMDRKLWADGGYYLTNGAALCAAHHIDAEEGRITPIECMQYMGINAHDVRTPDALKQQYPENSQSDDYTLALTSGLLDKWGHIVEKKDYDPDWYKHYNKKK